MDAESLRKIQQETRSVVDPIQRANTREVCDFMVRDLGLENLGEVLDPVVSKVYQSVIPDYARLCQIGQERQLDEAERALLAVKYASLYPTFGHDGMVTVAATWLLLPDLREKRKGFH